MQFGFEVFEAEIGAWGQPLVFEFAPEDFDEVKFWTVGRQPVQADALAEPVRDAGLKGVAGMDRRVIEDDQTECPGAGGLGGEGVESGDDGGGSDAAGDGPKVALIRGAEESQHVHARAGGAGKGQGLTAWLPGIWNGRRERKTALVEIKQLDHPLGMTSPEFVQARVRRTKGSFIAPAFDPSPTPLPTVGFIFDDPVHRLPAGALARRLPQLGLRLLGLAGFRLQPAAQPRFFRRRVNPGPSGTGVIIQAAQTIPLLPVQPAADRVHIHFEQQRQGDPPMPPMGQIHRLRPPPYSAVRPVFPGRPQRFALRFAQRPDSLHRRQSTPINSTKNITRFLFMSYLYN